MRDEGHDETEEILKEIEKRISEVYAQAEKEVAATLDDYLRKFEAKDKLKLKALANGLITEEEYKQWRVGQIAIGQRWAEMRDTLAQDFTNADKIARSIAFDHMPKVYALNHNYGTFQVEKASGIDTSYTLYDTNAFEELMKNEDTFIPAPGRKVSRDIKEGKALAWNKKAVQSAMMQSLLQGESIPKIATRLAKTVGESDRKAAIRNARTLTTGVENAGRIASYDQANKMGIPTRKQWLATLDSRTRHWHASLDGETVDNDKPFVNEFGEIMFPGDPKADPANIFNCRCTLIASIKGFEHDSPNKGLVYKDELHTMTYDEWKAGHYEQTSDDIEKQDRIAEAMRAKYGAEYAAYNESERYFYRGQTPELTDKTERDIVHENAITKTMEADNVEYLEVKMLERELTEAEIIAKVGGGDLTHGSCQSLALAYAGNRCGYDVVDYRDGLSRVKFARTQSIKTVSTFEGVISAVENNSNDYIAVANLLKKVENDKEYILSVGKHCAIIRKAGQVYEYLELQSEKDNTWKRITNNELKVRFGCVKKHTSYGIELKSSSVLIEVDSLKGNADFKNILGYLNTEPDKQKKGKGGRPK